MSIQEDKAPVMLSLDTVNTCLNMMARVVSTMRFNKGTMYAKVSSGFINATDLADYLVLKGVPFREAHGIVGASVRYCIDNGKKLEELSIDEFRKFSNLIDKDVYDAISIEACVERRNSEGGTSSQSTDLQIMQAIQEYMQREEVVRQETDLIERCWSELVE